MKRIEHRSNSDSVRRGDEEDKDRRAGPWEKSDSKFLNADR